MKSSKKLLQLLLNFCFLLSIRNAWAANSPVFLWGAESPQKPHMKLITQEEFENLLEPLLINHTIVAFLEPQLTTLDFMCRNARNQQPCYVHMSKITTSKTYYGSVQRPINALYEVASPEVQSISLHVNGTLPESITCQPGSVSIVLLDNFVYIDQNRAQLLEAHDAAIHDISLGLTKCHIVFLYMAAPIVRIRRQGPETPPTPATNDPTDTPDPTNTPDSTDEADPNDTQDPNDTPDPNDSTESTSTIKSEEDLSNGVFFDHEYFTIYYMNITLKGDTGDEIALDFEEMTVEKNGGVLSVELHGQHTMKFDVLLIGYYYVITKFIVQDVTYHATEVEVPQSMSYCCGILRLYTTNSTLTFHKFQFETHIHNRRRRRGNTSGGLENPNSRSLDIPETFSFSEAWDCVGFFSPAIISGIFVMALIIGITSVGVCWIMDIGSNDRFEDPKAPMLVIHATD